MWKLCGKAHVLQSFGRFCRNCAFSQNIHIKKLGETTLYHTVIIVIAVSVFHRISTGTQPEIFQDRGGFVKLGHFDKHFIKQTRKKAQQGKILEFFLLDILKTTF